MSKEPNLQRMSKEEIDEIKIDAYMSKEQTPKYRYHIHLLIYDNYTNFYHSFNSNSEILKTSEIREQLKEKKSDANFFLVANIVRTIND